MSPNASSSAAPFAAEQTDSTVETSLGWVALTADECKTLTRLLADAASMDEGQGFYKALVDRGVPLPMEWELHILRATVAALPDRDDLIARLALVEETITPVSAGADPTSRLAFERAWVRFSRTDIVGTDDGRDLPGIRKDAIEDACALLASPVFGKQPVERQVVILAALHSTLMSAPSADLPLVADLGLRRFKAMLDDPGLTEAGACAVFDALHSLYFAGVSDVRDLRRFDAIVPPFEAWLENRVGRHPRPTVASPNGRMLTVVYLLHTSHFERGNAVSPLIASIAEMHSARPDRRILVYAVQHVAPGFVEQMNEKGVTVCAIPQDSRYDRIDEVAASLRADNADVVVTEQNRAIAAALFVRRVAPRQMWIDTGFPFWSLKALDWTLSPVFADSPGAPPRTSAISFRQSAASLRTAVDAEAVSRVRSALPTDAFVLGVFVRLIKLNQAYLDFLGRLMDADPRFYLIIAGPGDSQFVDAFVARSDLAGRVTYVQGSVDLNVYGPAIDLMCDTFPFIGGNACREVSAHGTPVLAMLGTPWDALLRKARNPDLLARTEEEYIALARRMAADDKFRARQRRVTLDMAEEYGNPEQVIDDVEAAIAKAVAYYQN